MVSLYGLHVRPIGRDTSPIWILHAGPPTPNVIPLRNWPASIAGQHPGETNGCSLSTDQSHMIHVWYIYLHLP